MADTLIQQHFLENQDATFNQKVMIDNKNSEQIDLGTLTSKTLPSVPIVFKIETHFKDHLDTSYLELFCTSNTSYSQFLCTPTANSYSQFLDSENDNKQSKDSENDNKESKECSSKEINKK
jgi:hypothetical protein